MLRLLTQELLENKYQIAKANSIANSTALDEDKNHASSDLIFGCISKGIFSPY